MPSGLGLGVLLGMACIMVYRAASSLPRPQRALLLMMLAAIFDFSEVSFLRQASENLRDDW